MYKPKAKRPPPRAAADFSEIPAALLARMKPSKRGRPPQGAAPKQAIALRVDKGVLAAYKAQGPGWQSRMQATLKRGGADRSKGEAAQHRMSAPLLAGRKALAQYPAQQASNYPHRHDPEVGDHAAKAARQQARDQQQRHSNDRQRP